MFYFKKSIASRWLIYLLLAVCQLSCTSNVSEPLNQNNKAIPADRLASVTPSILVQSPSPVPTNQLISSEGIGNAKLGMTLGELKQVLGTGTELNVKSPFMVDFDAIVVSQSGKIQYYILYPTGKILTDSDRIVMLLTDNPNYRTAEGVGSEMLLKQAEAIYGKATLFYNTSNESREYVRFVNQPNQSLRFRSISKAQRLAGIYSSQSQEYKETKKFVETASIRSIEVVCSSHQCPKPSTN